MMNDTLLEALEKTYAEVPFEMFEHELIILISNDWQFNLDNKLNKYRGIEVSEFNITMDNQSIVIMKKSDYYFCLNIVWDSIKDRMKDFKL